MSYSNDPSELTPEAIWSRLASIDHKLAAVPETGAANYYIYYKEDVRFLLNLLEESKPKNVVTIDVQNAAEGFTYLHIQHNRLKKTMENIAVQMSFLLMNVENHNFVGSEETDHRDLKHALQELRYLAQGAKKLEEQAANMTRMATKLGDKLANQFGLNSDWR